MSNELVSIKSGTSAAARAVLTVTATTTPTAAATDGTPCPRSRYLHVIGSLAGAPAETADYEVCVFDAISESWTRVSDIGTNGTVSLDTISPTAGATPASQLRSQASTPFSSLGIAEGPSRQRQLMSIDAPFSFLIGCEDTRHTARIKRLANAATRAAQKALRATQKTKASTASKLMVRPHTPPLSPETATCSDLPGRQQWVGLARPLRHRGLHPSRAAPGLA